MTFPDPYIARRQVIGPGTAFGHGHGDEPGTAGPGNGTVTGSQQVVLTRRRSARGVARSTLVTSEPARTVRRPLSPVEAALVAEACTRSDLVWLRPDGDTRHHAAWHVWHDDAVCVVYGTGEQVLPVISGEIDVVARSKDSGAQVIGFRAHVDTLTSRTPEWDAAAQALSASRLNAADPAGQRERWATGTVISLLRPVAVHVAARGDDDSPSGSAPPPGGPGTTLQRRPFHLGGRARRGLRLRRRRAEGGTTPG